MDSKMVSTLAGNQKRGYLNRCGTNAQFNYPFAITIHKKQNYLYISEDNHTIRTVDISLLENLIQKMSLSDNNSKNWQMYDILNNAFEVSTLCGEPKFPGFEDGVGKGARFAYPSGMCFSPNNENLLFVCDSGNHSIRKIDVTTQQVSTFAGHKLNGFRNGKTFEARFFYPKDVCFDRNDNLYICDCSNNAIRKIDKHGNVSTITRDVIYPNFILYDEIRNQLIFSQQQSITSITFVNHHFHSKLKNLFRITRLIAVNSKGNLIKKLVLYLISIEIVQLPQLSPKQVQIKDSIIEYASNRASLMFIKNLDKTNSTFIDFVFNHQMKEQHKEN